MVYVKNHWFKANNFGLLLKIKHSEFHVLLFYRKTWFIEYTRGRSSTIQEHRSRRPNNTVEKIYTLHDILLNDTKCLRFPIPEAYQIVQWLWFCLNIRILQSLLKYRCVSVHNRLKMTTISWSRILFETVWAKYNRLFSSICSNW